MKAIYIMETHRWEEASELVPKAHTDSYSRMRIHWVRAIAESRLGDIFKAEEDLNKLRQDFSDLRKNLQDHDKHSFPQDCKVVARMVLGGLHHEYRWERIAA